MVTHHSTNPAVHGRELNSRPVDQKADALTITAPSYPSWYCQHFQSSVVNNHMAGDHIHQLIWWWPISRQGTSAEERKERWSGCHCVGGWEGSNGDRQLQLSRRSFSYLLAYLLTFLFMSLPQNTHRPQKHSSTQSCCLIMTRPVSDQPRFSSWSYSFGLGLVLRYWSCSWSYTVGIILGLVWHCLLHLVPAISHLWFACDTWRCINLFWLIDTLVLVFLVLTFWSCVHHCY